MNEAQIDPIQYAWRLCNPGVSLPTELVRGAVRDPVTGRVEGKVCTATDAAGNAAKAATHSGIVRRRMPRPKSLDPPTR